MTDAQVAEGATHETTHTPPAEAGFSLPETTQGQGSEAPQERNWDQEAREMGWVPEAEFKGEKKPAKFLDAKEFVERGETVLPFVKRENKRLKEQLEKTTKDHEARFEKLAKMAEKTLEAERSRHARELADLRGQREAAVQKGDVNEFRRLDKQIADHEASAPGTEEKSSSSENAQDEARRLEQDFVERHKSWYGKDDMMTWKAERYSQQLLRDNPNITMAENLAKTEEYIRQQFPMKFGKTDANGHAPVDGGGEPKSSATRTPLFDKLPQEAKDQAKKDVAAGVYKSVEDWARVYNS